MPKRLFALENLLNWLLVFVPVALLLRYAVHLGSPQAQAVAVFVTSALGIIPLAGVMGRATEHVAEQMGEGVGGLLNATFGNAAELIIAVLALRAGLHELVKASITGSIIGNVLLVFGLSAMVGGFRYETQRFNRTAAGLSTTMLVLSVVALVIPAIFHLVAGAGARQPERELSLEISIVLMLTYILSLAFTLRTHRHLYAGNREPHTPERGAEAGAPPPASAGSTGRAVGMLLLATAGVALMAELLVGAAETTAHSLGWNEVFVGVIVVAIIGNAAEHSTAVLMALKNRMDAALNIAIGSSLQVALFVAPLLVFLSYAIGPQPMNLLFTPMEVVAVGASVGIIALIAVDGESHWMEGVLLLAVYAILGIAFFWLPG